MPPFGLLPHCSTETMTRGGTVRQKTSSSEGPMNRLCCLGESAGPVVTAQTEDRGAERSEWAARDLRRERAVRRIWEGVDRNGGGRTYSLVGDKLDVAACDPTTERTAVATAPAIQPTAAPMAPARRIYDKRSPRAAECVRTCRSPAFISGPTIAAPPPKKSLLSLFRSRRINPVVRKLLALQGRRCSRLGTEHL